MPVPQVSEPEGLFTMGQIAALLEAAEKQGYPMERGSYVENMTVKQLARLMQGVHDA